MKILLNSLFFALLCIPCLAPAQDTFDGQRLTIPKVLVNNDVYFNVVITVSEVVSVAGGAPSGNYDTYRGGRGHAYTIVKRRVFTEHHPGELYIKKSTLTGVPF